MTDPGNDEMKKFALSPYPLEFDVNPVQLVEDAMLWLYAADRDNLRHGRELLSGDDEHGEVERELIKNAQEDSDVVALMRQKVASGDMFFIRFVAGLESAAKSTEYPEDVRVEQFDDLCHIIRDLNSSLK